jgi:hypothetical protein
LRFNSSSRRKTSRGRRGRRGRNRFSRNNNSRRRDVGRGRLRRRGRRVRGVSLVYAVSLSLSTLFLRLTFPLNHTGRRDLPSPSRARARDFPPYSSHFPPQPPSSRSSPSPSFLRPSPPLSSPRPRSRRCPFHRLLHRRRRLLPRLLRHFRRRISLVLSSFVR